MAGNPIAMRVLRALRTQDQPRYTRDICGALNTSYTRTHDYLSALEGMGLVERRYELPRPQGTEWVSWVITSAGRDFLYWFEGGE